MGGENTESDAYSQIDQAYWWAAEQLLGWGESEDRFVPITHRSASEMRALYLTVLRLMADRADADLTIGAWAHHFGASWEEIGEATKTGPSMAHRRYSPVAEALALRLRLDDRPHGERP